MKASHIVVAAVSFFILQAAALAAVPQMAITEFMYNGLGTGGAGEYAEFTNMTAAPIDMTGWSFDDNHRTAGVVSLSGFGTVQPGQSVILTDDTAANFRTNWNLPASVVIIGGNTANLGRADEVNLYDNTSTLIDRLTYDDQTLGGPRTNGVAGGPASDSVLGANTITSWSLLSTAGAAGDPHSVGVLTSSAGEKGNPGAYLPEPGSLGLLGLGVILGLRRRIAR